MNPVDEDLAVLANAVRTPTAGLTAVEIDTEAHARDVIEHLRDSLSDRPSAILSLVPTSADAASGLLTAARQAIRDWPPGAGVLCLVHPDRIEAEDTERREFWRELNLRREGWGALDCHVIFFLLPAPYDDLLRLADHLADWMPLKLRLLGTDEPTQSSPTPDRMLQPGSPSPAVAREELARLERDLADALASPSPPPSAVLIRRYYLPMLRNAIAIIDLRRAKALAGKVNADDVPQADLPAFWGLLFQLHYHLRDFEEAEIQTNKLQHWAQDSGTQEYLAQAHHQLGMIAQEQRDFKAAEAWYLRSLEITEKSGNEHGAASTYQQLGRVAQDQRDFATAEKWYRRSLEINEKSGNDHRAASTCHQLGMIAQEQRDFKAAEAWYLRSLEIKEKSGNDHGAAITRHQLGRIAQEQRDFAAAENWYRRSLEILEKSGDEYRAAITYHQLGMIAEEQRDFKAAATWYRRSLEIKEKSGNDHGAAGTYHQLGILAALQGAFEDGATWMTRSAKGFSSTHDPHLATQVARNFIAVFREADEPTQTKMAAIWNEAGLDPVESLLERFPEDKG